MVFGWKDKVDRERPFPRTVRGPEFFFSIFGQPRGPIDLIEKPTSFGGRLNESHSFPSGVTRRPGTRRQGMGRVWRPTRKRKPMLREVLLVVFCPPLSIPVHIHRPPLPGLLVRSSQCSPL